jgi:Cu/Ag efflux protein CusF
MRKTCSTTNTHHDHDAQHDHAMHHATMEMSSGEIRKIDKDAGKLTIKHGPLTIDGQLTVMRMEVKN